MTMQEIQQLRELLAKAEVAQRELLAAEQRGESMFGATWHQYAPDALGYKAPALNALPTLLDAAEKWAQVEAVAKWLHEEACELQMNLQEAGAFTEAQVAHMKGQRDIVQNVQARLSLIDGQQ